MRRVGRSRLAILVALAFVPKLAIDLPYVFKGPLNTPGTLQLLALCLVFGGLALSYDLLFGFTGLMSFGHALYFAIGVYIAAIAMTRWHWGFWPSVGVDRARRASCSPSCSAPSRCASPGSRSRW